tara:strand:- start:607 stop:846 length:240 start_codon:yes stop_codon:yes gene_type:complete
MNKFEVTTPYDFDKAVRDVKRERTRKVQMKLRDWIVRGFKTESEAEQRIVEIIAATDIAEGEVIVQEYTPLTELNQYFN